MQMSVGVDINIPRSENSLLAMGGRSGAINPDTGIIIPHWLDS